jgi:predicted flap endonuclease-1-like 5' DNA nuclease
MPAQAGTARAATRLPGLCRAQFPGSIRTATAIPSTIPREDFSMSYKIEEIEGIGPAYAGKLEAAGISTTDDLLQHCADPAGRKATAGNTGLSESQLLKWANLSDLMRISGVGAEYSELLEAAGVDTVKELRTRVAANLATRMAEVNATRKLTRTLPGEKVVSGWIEQANALNPLISH